MKRFATGLLALGAVAGVASCSPPASAPEDASAPVVEPDPPDPAPPWGSVLDGAGARAADALLARARPACLHFTDPVSVEREARALRETMLTKLDLDAQRPARSAVVQRTVPGADYDIEIVRLEVVEGIYLPLNVYLPHGALASVPVVLSPVGCGSSGASPDVQARAANLAMRGFIVVVSEGFCDNGARATLADSDAFVGYGRQLLGLPGDLTIYLQELLTTLTWVLGHYAVADAERVGVAGYSYGGQMSVFLAQADPRVRSVSVPATYFGGPCDVPLAVSDLHVLHEAGPDFRWGAPLELPQFPRNWRIVALYPRFLHTTVGSLDRGAPPDVIRGAMLYAEELWSLAGLEDRVRYLRDRGDHSYGRARREDTYEWLARTLLGDASPLDRAERTFQTRSAAELAVDISGTATLAGELRAAAATERERRFPDGSATAQSAARARRAAEEWFGNRVAPLEPEVVWDGEIGAFKARALRYRGELHDVPAVELAGSGPAGSGVLLFLSERGIGSEVDTLLDRAARFERVVAVDCLGIGELASDRLMLHTVARALMHHEPSLLQWNVGIVRGIVGRVEYGQALEVEGSAWASSLLAAVLGAREPQRVRRVQTAGVPDDELGWVGEGRAVPDLLLHARLFSRLTVAELTAAPSVEPGP